MRVCQFRHFGKSERGNYLLPFRKERQVIFYRGSAGCQTRLCSDPFAGFFKAREKMSMSDDRNSTVETNKRLRSLAHDLSNSLETVLQAAYLLGQAKIDPDAKRWVQMIDSASQEATRINREIREILRSQSEA